MTVHTPNEGTAGSGHGINAEWIKKGFKTGNPKEGEHLDNIGGDERG
jgi:hypothetical protein